MGNVFSNSQKTPLRCLISNLRTLKIKGTIKTKQLTFYCQEVWPTYPLIGKPWPRQGTFDPCILRNLYDFCQAGNKLLELPYVQAFLILRTRPSLIKSCAPAEILLAKSTAPQTFPSCPPLFSQPPPAYHQIRSLPLPPTGPLSPPPVPDSLSSSNSSPLQIPPTVRSSPSPPSRTHSSPSSSNPSVSQLSPDVPSSPPPSPGTHNSPSSFNPSVSASSQSPTSSPENSVSPTAFSPPAHHTRSRSLCPSSRSRDCSSLRGEQSPCCNPLPRGMAPPCSGGPHGDRAPPCFGSRDRAPPCSQAPPCFGLRDRVPPCFQDPYCQQASPCGSSCELQQPPCCSAHDASLCCRQQSSSYKAHSEMPSARVSQGDRQQLCSRSTDDCSHAPIGRMAAQKPSVPEPPQALLPLREQVGPKELVNIHVPFSLSDLSQITLKLGSLSVDPQNYIRQFKFITNGYDLHFKDVYNDSGPIAVPEQDKHTNYNKFLKQVQEANQNPAVFLNWLSNPRALRAVPASRAVSGRLPAPPPCAVPAPPSPVRRRRRRCHLTRFRGQSEPAPARYIPALAPPTGRALPECRETAAQRLCSGMLFYNLAPLKRCFYYNSQTI
ncbi:proline-rich protein 36-like isoform X1 [Cavia porcellus]|uniref:proline-rich protein 36-like isoform X1 n=1 Tax=Cavia porcellus TaxID=10141 RepID=UPI002FDF602E